MESEQIEIKRTVHLKYNFRSEEAQGKARKLCSSFTEKGYEIIYYEPGFVEFAVVRRVVSG